MWRDQVRELDKLVLERRGHIVVVSVFLLVLGVVNVNLCLARTAWTASCALDGRDRFLGRGWRSGLVRGRGRDQALLGVRDVQQVTNRFVLSLEFRSHVLGYRNTAARVQERLEYRFLPDR